MLCTGLSAGAAPKKKTSKPATKAPPAKPTPAAPARTYADKLAAILARQPRATGIGFVALDAATGETLFAHEGDKLLKPASVMKLLPSATALDRFGPQFQYETRVYLKGADLYVVGAGDPSLGDDRLAERLQRSREVFETWAGILKARGVTRLEHVFVDDTIFEARGRHPDWPLEQADRWYQAPVGGLNINDNCVDATFDVRGKELVLKLMPALPPSMFENRVSVGSKRTLVGKRPANTDVFEFVGMVNGDWSLNSIAAHDATIFFAQSLAHTLERAGIDVAAQPARHTLSPAELADATLLAAPTTNLMDVIWRANTCSQNLFAEALLKTLPAYEPDGRRAGVQGTWEAGHAVVRETLGKLGVDLSGAKLRDGSGLSHSNRVTAAQLGKLLVVMHKHRHAKLFYDSLAEPGETGSMERRYLALRGKMRAKTGTLQGVHALAGYLTRNDGRVVVFALLVNGACTNTLPVDLCRTLLEEPLKR